MHYETSYKNLPREEADEKAIQDIMDYLGTEKTSLFGDLVQLATYIELDKEIEGRKQTIQSLNMTFGFGGISGYPFHAFCRRYCLSKYRAWMADGSDSISTDEQGFTISE